MLQSVNNYVIGASENKTNDNNYVTTNQNYVTNNHSSSNNYVIKTNDNPGATHMAAVIPPGGNQMGLGPAQWVQRNPVPEVSESNPISADAANQMNCLKRPPQLLDVPVGSPLVVNGGRSN